MTHLAHLDPKIFLPPRFIHLGNCPIHPRFTFQLPQLNKLTELQHRVYLNRSCILSVLFG